MRQLDIHVVRFEGSQEEAVSGLQTCFGLNREAAVRFVTSLPRVARSATGPREALAYQQALQALGAVVELRPARSLAPPLDPSVPSLPTPPLGQPLSSSYDSSEQLARRIPRAPAVPKEARRRAHSGFDELGNRFRSSTGDDAWRRGRDPGGTGRAAEEAEADPTYGADGSIASGSATDRRLHLGVQRRKHRRGLLLGIVLLATGAAGSIYWRVLPSSSDPAEQVPDRTGHSPMDRGEPSPTDGEM